MRVSDSNWMDMEAYLKNDDRAVIPLGSTEQHAYLSLCVDNILSGRVATEAAEPLGIPVFPVLNYGVTPYFLAYPGTVSLRLTTYFQVVGDILSSLERTGFRRIALVNGHGGNSPVQGFAVEWMVEHPDVTVKVHNWWSAPKTWAMVQEIDKNASHASWMENFPWTRLARSLPTDEKPMIDLDYMRTMNPAQVRTYLKEGNFGGVFQKPDEVMQRLWEIGVTETRAALEGPW
jgi:creatinine amidohydrolase